MYQIQHSSTPTPLLFMMIDVNDHITGKTGLSPTVTLSKNGGTFASPSGAVSEIANGWYKVAGNATDTNTLGPLVLHATGTSADPADITFEVVAHNVQDAIRLGLSALPNATAEAAGGLYTRGTGTGQIRQDANGRIDINIRAVDNAPIASPAVTGVMKVDVSHWLGTAAATPTVAGVPEVDITHFGGSAGTFASGRPEVNTTHWGGTAIASANVRANLIQIDNAPIASPGVSGVLKVDVTHWLSSAAATPTVAGVPEVDLTHVAGSTTNVSALATNVDAILTDTAEIGVAGAGLTNINLPDQTMNITGNITGNLSGSVGSVTAKVTANVIEWASSPTASVAVAGVPKVDVTHWIGTAAAIPTVAGVPEVDITHFGGTAGTFASGVAAVNTTQISGSSESADRLERSTLAIVTGTVGVSSTTTAIIFSALSPTSGVNDQFKGRIITFDKDTTTVALRGQATDITAYTHATLTATVTALTTAPVSGDTCSIT